MGILSQWIRRTARSGTKVSRVVQTSSFVACLGADTHIWQLSRTYETKIFPAQQQETDGISATV